MTKPTDPYASWKHWAPGDFGRHSVYDDRYYRWHLVRAGFDLMTRLRVLEIGFGNGGFMGWLRAGGHAVCGLEANAQLVERAVGAGFDAAFDVDGILAPERFDLIAAFDVLEHVAAADLQPFIERLLMRLAPDGRLLLRFPNGESPFGLWMQHGDLTHVHALGLSKIRQLCAACGLLVTHSGETLPWRAQPPSRRWGAAVAAWSRRRFEWRLRKMYGLPRGLDLSPNQLVVLTRV
jgi:SAM-dependent methyltransferase